MQFKARSLIGTAVTLIAFELIAQIFFISIFRMQLQSIDTAVNGIFQNEYSSQDPLNITRGLTQLERAGLIQCLTLKQLTPIERNELAPNSATDCSDDRINLRRTQWGGIFTSINGQSYQVSAIALLPKLQYITFWIIRAMIILCVLGSIWVFNLISTKRQMKAELQLKHLREMSELAAQVAHDIRSPVTAIQMLASSMHSNDPEIHKAFQKSLSQIQGIARMLLSRRKLEAHFGADQKELTEVNHAMENLALEVRAKYSQDPTIQIRFDIQQPASLAIIPVSDIALQCALSNMISNGIESRAVGAPITISVHTTIRNNKLNIAVQDNGMGMHWLTRINYGRLNFVSTKVNGNGMGSYSLRKFLEKSNANLQITSKSGLGTRINIEFPIIELSADTNSMTNFFIQNPAIL